MFASLALAFILALGGGTVAAAEQAAPGNALYPVKVHVNETVRGALAIGDDKEAAWQTKKAERRLHEASTLAAKGELSAEKEGVLVKKFDAHTTKTKALIAKLEEKGNAEAAASVRAALEARLDAFDDLIETLKTNSPDAAEKMKALHEKTREEGKIIKNTVKEMKPVAAERKKDGPRDDSDDDKKSEKPTTALEGRLRATEHKIANVKDYLAERSDEVSVEAAARATAQLAEADKMIVDGKALMAAGKNNDAFALFQKAHFSAERAKNLLHNARGFGKIELKGKLDARIDDKKEDKETRDDKKIKADATTTLDVNVSL